MTLMKSRSISATPAILLRPETDLVVLLLTLESDDFPACRVALKDPATKQVRWRSATVTATSAGEKKVVSVSFRPEFVEGAELQCGTNGISAQGGAEIAGYPFRAVLK